MCEQREQLIAYLYDEVDANERRSVESHLTTCETCREELRAFRDVRQDLLAWDVPAHESVWKPFVTARTQPVWRQMPAWAMAAAAMLVFGIGIAGGYAGRVLASRNDAPAQVAAAQPIVQPTNVTPAASLEDLRALQSRLTDLEHAASVRTVSNAPVSTSSAAADAATLAKVEQLIHDSEGRVTQKTLLRVISIVGEIDRQRRTDNAMLLQQVNDMQERTNGTILAVKNTMQRSEKEKE